MSRRCIFEVFTAVHLGARLQALSSARTQSQLRRAHRERRLHRMLPGLWRGVDKGAPLCCRSGTKVWLGVADKPPWPA